jgi:hypothetical protein
VAAEPTINPYAPPTSDGEARPSELGAGAFARPLFSPRQGMMATLFGTVMAGALLLQANYRAMGRSGAANKTLVLGFLSTAALIAIGMALPKEVPGLPINIAVAFGFLRVFESLQGDAFSIHSDAGGARQSNWWVFGVIAATVVALCLVMFGVLFASGTLFRYL